MTLLPERLNNWMFRTARARLATLASPLRAELFSVDQLAHHAKTLAGRHQLATRKGANRLLDQLGQNEHILRTFNRATLASGQSRSITPAAE